MQTLWLPPRLHKNTGHEEERKVTWLELFYDLVYVATLIQIGNTLSENVSVTGLLQFAIVFAPIWWAWTGMTFYMNRFVVDDGWHRGLIFLQICAIAWLGVSVEGAFGQLAAQFALTYATIRLVLVLLYLRTWKHVPEAKPLTQRYVAAHSLGLLIWIVSAFSPAPVNYVLWLAALIVEIGNVYLPETRRLQSLLPPDPPHMVERYGIFTLIVLGESFIKTITDGSGVAITFESFIFSLFGIGVVFGLWWIYFNDVAEAVIKPTPFAPYIWIYAHLPLAIGLTIFGVASKKLFLSVGSNHVEDKYLVIFCMAMVLYGLALALIDYVTTRADQSLPNSRRSPMRGGIAVFFLMLAFWADGLSPLTLVIISAVIMTVQIGAELFLTTRRAALSAHSGDG